MSLSSSWNGWDSPVAEDLRYRIWSIEIDPHQCSKPLRVMTLGSRAMKAAHSPSLSSNDSAANPVPRPARGQSPSSPPKIHQHQMRVVLNPIVDLVQYTLFLRSHPVSMLLKGQSVNDGNDYSRRPRNRRQRVGFCKRTGAKWSHRLGDGQNGHPSAPGSLSPSFSLRRAAMIGFSGARQRHDPGRFSDFQDACRHREKME